MMMRLNLDLDILKMYLNTKYEVPRSSHGKGVARVEKGQRSM